MPVVIRKTDTYTVTAEYFDNATSLDLFVRTHSDDSERPLGIVQRDAENQRLYVIEGSDYVPVEGLHSVVEMLMTDLLANDPWAAV